MASAPHFPLSSAPESGDALMSTLQLPLPLQALLVPAITVPSIPGLPASMRVQGLCRPSYMFFHDNCTKMRMLDLQEA